MRFIQSISVVALVASSVFMPARGAWAQANSEPVSGVVSPAAVPTSAITLSPGTVMGVPVYAPAEKKADPTPKPLVQADQKPHTLVSPSAAVVSPSTVPLVPAPPVAEVKKPISVTSGTVMGTPVLSPEEKKAEAKKAPQPVSAAPHPVAVVAPPVSPPSPAPSLVQKEQTLTLAQAVKQILPSSYKVEFAPSVDKNLPVVKPEAGQDWAAQMDKLARAYGLRMEATARVIKISAAETGLVMSAVEPSSVMPPEAEAQVSAPISLSPAVLSPETQAASKAEVSLPPVVPPPAPQPRPESQIEPQAEPQAESMSAPPSDLSLSAPAGTVTDVPSAEKEQAETGKKALWKASRGQTLMEVLQAWCNEAGVQLYWDSRYDYPLQASLALSGSFEDAVRVILEGFDGASPQPVGKLHRQGASGGKILVIQSRGNNYGTR